MATRNKVESRYVGVACIGRTLGGSKRRGTIVVEQLHLTLAVSQQGRKRLGECQLSWSWSKVYGSLSQQLTRGFRALAEKLKHLDAALSVWSVT